MLYRLVRPLLFRLDAEAAHGLGVRAARWGERVPGAVERLLAFRDERLAQTLWGVGFPNPVGLAAGFDKNAELAAFWARVGFGFCEVGSVSARAAAGNPRPRAFRLPESRALVNRMGLNNAGAAAVARRLAALPPRGQRPVPLGVNLAKTHDPAILGEAGVEDFAASFRLLAPHADYVALNVSCPNTAEGKTFEDEAALDALLARVMALRDEIGAAAPVLVKLSPPPPTGVDEAAVDALIALCLRHGVHGFIATNTASDRSGIRESSRELEKIGRGGLSGRPLRRRATALVRHLYRATEGRVPIVGVGGVDSAEAAYEKIRAGASLVQLYTGLVYGGPGLPGRINRGLVRLLERDGLGSVAEAVGVDA